jgi:hypothetical protein
VPSGFRRESSENSGRPRRFPPISAAPVCHVIATVLDIARNFLVLLYYYRATFVMYPHLLTHSTLLFTQSTSTGTSSASASFAEPMALSEDACVGTWLCSSVESASNSESISSVTSSISRAGSVESR